MRVLRFVATALLVSASVSAQEEPARRQATEVAARVPFEKAMKGAPYSAEVIIESSQTLPDGNRINRKTTGAVYRDGEGRTRREEDVMLRSMSPAAASAGAVTTMRKTISIVDPVGGFSYSLDPERKIAWRTPAGGANAIMDKVEMSQASAEAAAMREKLVVEERLKTLQGETGQLRARSAAPAGGGGGRIGGPGNPGPLEHKTIEGVAVEGRKTTTIIPAGQVGNEQPITITSEEWRSPDLNLLVLTRHADPRTGESTYRLQNIIRAEPDHSLFVVPSDYEVKDTGIRRMLEASRQK